MVSRWALLLVAVSGLPEALAQQWLPSFTYGSVSAAKATSLSLRLNYG